MHQSVEIDMILKGIKKYMDFYGYNLERTETGPHIGKAPTATLQHFDSFNGELTVLVDKSDDTWIIEFKITDALDRVLWNKKIEQSGSLKQIAQVVQETLGELPRNTKKALSLDESFLDNFTKSALYLIKKDFFK